MMHSDDQELSKTSLEWNDEQLDRTVAPLGKRRRRFEWCSLSAAVVIAGVAAMLAASGIYLALFHHRPSAADTMGPVITSPGATQQISWSIPAGALSSSTESGLRSALSTQNLGPIASSSRDLDIRTGYVDGDWGVLYGQMRTIDTHEVIPSDGITLLAHKAATGWQIISPQSREFCSTLHQLPNAVMSQEAKDYVLGCRD